MRSAVHDPVPYRRHCPKIGVLFQPVDQSSARLLQVGCGERLVLCRLTIHALGAQRRIWEADALDLPREHPDGRFGQSE
jgi:hypothetical protein